MRSHLSTSTILNRMWISMFHFRREVQIRYVVIQRASKYILYITMLAVICLFLDSGGHTLGRRITIQITEYNGNPQVCLRGDWGNNMLQFERFNETPFSLRLKSRAPFDGQQTWSCLSIPRIYGRIFLVSVVFRRIHLFDTETTTITGFSLITQTTEMIVEAQHSEASPRGKKSLSPELWRSAKCRSSKNTRCHVDVISWYSK